MEFSERLKLARERAGFKTAKEAATRLQVPYGTYSGHESGTRGVKADEAIKYARLYNVDVGWLAFGVGENFYSSAKPAHHIGKLKADGKYEQIHTMNNPKFSSLYPALPIGDAVQMVVTIEGDALHGLAEAGSAIYVGKGERTSKENYAGRLCLCHTLDDIYGSVFGWPQIAGADQVFNVERINQPTIREVAIKTINPVLGILTKMALEHMDKQRIRNNDRIIMPETHLAIPIFRDIDPPA